MLSHIIFNLLVLLFALIGAKVGFSVVYSTQFISMLDNIPKITCKIDVIYVHRGEESHISHNLKSMSHTTCSSG